MPSYSPVNSLIRGIEVLRALNELGQGSVGDLHQITKYPKPTIVRILETFKAAGYVADMSPGETYCLTAKVLLLSSGFADAREVIRIAVPLIDDFRGEVVWPSDVAIFDCNEMVIINTSRKPGTLSVNRTVGSRVPLLLTALGRAYYSNLPQEQRNKIANAIAVGDYADSKVARQPRVMKSLLQKTVERGYAISDRENVPTIRAIAVPILRHDVAVGAFNIIVVADAMSAQKMQKTYARKMLQLSKKIAVAMGQG